jgi:hypothetical protein
MLKVSTNLVLSAVACFAQAPEAVLKPATETTRQVNDRARLEII